MEAAESGGQRRVDPTARDRFEVIGVTSAPSNQVAAAIVSVVRTIATLVTGGLVPETPKSKVRVLDRRTGGVLVEYHHGHDLGAATEHLRQLDERLDQQGTDEFVHGLGLTDIPRDG